MSELLSALNYDESNITAQSVVALPANAGQKVVKVDNPESFITNGFVVIGRGENAEMGQINSITGQNLNLIEDLQLDHIRDESVTQLLGNTIRFFRAPNTDGSRPASDQFSILATVEITPDQMATTYLDNDGGANYWYKFIYYNDFNDNDYTDLDDAIAVRGGDSGYYCKISDVRLEAGMKDNPWITDDEVLQKLVGAQGEVNSALRRGGYTLPLVDVPDMVAHATRLLAAGYLLLADYGPDQNGLTKDGNSKIAQAREILRGIAEGETALTVGNEVVTAKAGHGVSGFPRSVDLEDSPTGRPRSFTSDMEF